MSSMRWSKTDLFQILQGDGHRAHIFTQGLSCRASRLSARQDICVWLSFMPLDSYPGRKRIGHLPSSYSNMARSTGLCSCMLQFHGPTFHLDPVTRRIFNCDATHFSVPDSVAWGFQWSVLFLGIWRLLRVFMLEFCGDPH